MNKYCVRFQCLESQPFIFDYQYYNSQYNLKSRNVDQIGYLGLDE